MDIYYQIVNENLIFPSFIQDNDFKLLIQKMLSKNRITRMSKLSQIKNNIWFSNFNWDDLIALTMKASYIPKLNVIKEDDKQILFNEYAKKLPDLN